MKIAILLPGHTRSYNDIRKEIFQNLIDPLKNAGHTCHIFTSTWSDVGYRENGWQNVKADLSKIQNDSILFEVEEPKRNDFLQQYRKYDKWRQYQHLSGPETCGDAVGMWYKIWRCYVLMLEYMKQENIKYDVIIKSRPDLLLYEPFDVNLLSRMTIDTIYMAEWHGKYEQVTHHIMDQFGIGLFQSMSVYCSVYLQIDNIIYRNDGAFTGEGFLFSQLSSNSINIDRIPIHYGLKRHDKVVHFI